MKRRNFIFSTFGVLGAFILPTTQANEKNSGIIYCNYIPIIVNKEFREFVKFFKNKTGFDLNSEQRNILHLYFNNLPVGLFSPEHKRQIGFSTLIYAIAAFEAQRGKEVCIIINYSINETRRYAYYRGGCIYSINSIEHIRGHSFDKILVDTSKPLTQKELDVILPAIKTNI